MEIIVYLPIVSYREHADAHSLGIFLKKEDAFAMIEKKGYNPDFSEPNGGYWGTEEYTINLEEHVISVPPGILE